MQVVDIAKFSNCKLNTFRIDLPAVPSVLLCCMFMFAQILELS